MATPEETEMVLKELEEMEKQKRIEEIAAKTLEIELEAKSIMRQNLIDKQKEEDKLFFNDGYKGEIRVVSEIEEVIEPIDFDLSKKSRDEILELFG
jgi:hypothetical protein